MSTVIPKYWKCFAASTLQNSTPRSHHSLVSLHDSDIQFIRKWHLRLHAVRKLFLKTQIVPVVRRHQPYQVRLPNLHPSRLLKMLRSVSLEPYTLRLRNGWGDLSGSIPRLESTFLRSMSRFCRSNSCSVLERMEIRLGKAQLIKAINDGRCFWVLSTRFYINSTIATRDIIRGSISPQHLANKFRPNGKSTSRKMTKTLQIATPRNRTPKCLVKLVIPSSLTGWTTNIKRYSCNRSH